jgi:hypothetical protein
MRAHGCLVTLVVDPQGKGLDRYRRRAFSPSRIDVGDGSEPVQGSLRRG